MKVIVTGPGGYVGGHVSRALSRAGHEAVPLSRESGFRLGEPFVPDVFAGADALIHTAYDFAPRAWDEIERVNVHGSVALFRAAADAGVRRLIFLSSLAAYEGCRSLYGRGKLAVEAEVLRLSGDVVRPGVIYGGDAGGLFRTLSTIVARLPLIPLPGRGDQGLYLTHIDDLTALLGSLLSIQSSEAGRLLITANRRRWEFRELLERIAAEQSHRRRFLRVPSSLIFVLLRGTEALLGARLPVRSDSLVSLLNPDPAPAFRMPDELRGSSFRTFGT
jgi:nucleoside-diphosphate-sugar epimerase